MRWYGVGKGWGSGGEGVGIEWGRRGAAGRARRGAARRGVAWRGALRSVAWAGRGGIGNAAR